MRIPLAAQSVLERSQMNVLHYLARALGVLVTLLIMAGLSSCEKPAVATSAGPPEVLVTDVIQREVPVFEQWVGTLNGYENAEVRARVTGYLESRNYQEGSYVKKGDLLFQIDPRPFIAALDQANGELQQAQAKMIAEQLNAKRATELFQQKVISEQEYTNQTQAYRTELAAFICTRESLPS
jgi:membrane fusion protein, multidrug efflux system